ncbi:hypothetical protein TCE0_039r13241 [Talaromyces pinophilus]|uniref:NAD-dependent epimerase/dehydratase domain-containing protein n=1 Tax=Talaromyces pinophilus TaxID=128442 RepID=A0A6N4SLU6_TALPI|nr:hypothetical protein DPV78_004064 [Talaromyces pinophilus]PCH07627.1 Hypothetical protein PENO1_011070 [Penicillium occitanis (nom. inval.)]PCH09424.1 hypothetical protein PENOC_009900 [Penicillium occitanis (nom. inval.)]GAM40694.1 hypothetical protein TCE0_039r13241 [Talaromyces pinophilus]
MAAKRLVVAGGSGFLGSRICKHASVQGWKVVSLSRSGEPQWDTVTASKERPGWASNVEWAKADILKPATYKPYLKDATAVVHSMGILLEADYKGVVSGKESIVSGLQRAFSSTKRGTQDPLNRGVGEELRPQESDGQLTYEVMNRDTAIALAQESSFEHVPTFVYISAAGGAPMLPGRYISTKREAESIISQSLPELRSIFIRPGFLYDSSRKFTLPIALSGMVASEVDALVGGRLKSLVGSITEKPLKADVVAQAVVEAIADGTTSGVVGTKKIENLATQAWRKNML